MHWSSDLINVTLVNDQLKYIVRPLKDIPDVEMTDQRREDEIRVGDLVILAGRFMIVVEDERDGHPSVFMTNYLKIVDVSQENQSRRRANRSTPATQTSVMLIR